MYLASCYYAVTSNNTDDATDKMDGERPSQDVNVTAKVNDSTGETYVGFVFRIISYYNMLSL